MTLPTDRRWYFRDKHPGEPRQGDIPTQHALEEDVETFVRETLQNANDAGISGERPVEVYFRFVRLTGDELDAFKDALEWDELADHLEGAAGGDHSLRLEQYLNHLEETDELLMLVIEDRNTMGLTGAETADRSNYTALVRDMQVSHKNEGAGGSHGVGKTVLWAFSGISTVLFASVPENTNSREPPRLVGRTVLPDHRKNGALYEGLGWFGVDDTSDEELEHPASAWDGDAAELSEALQIDSYDPDKTGTSAAVVGFSSPLGDIQPDLDEVVTEFEKAAVKYFWPAIDYGQLSVYIETPGDDEPWAVSAENVPEIQPFRQAFNRGLDPDDELESPGDVVVKEIDFKPADKRDGTTTEAGKVKLVTRLRMPSDKDDLMNHVAMFRGAGMVVDYRDMSGVVSGNDFHAIFQTGEARAWTDDPTEADKDIEEFLRTAEPAAHKDWQSTSKLTKQYKQGRGYRSKVKQLKRQKLQQALDDLISTEDDRAGEFIPSISQHLPIGKSGSPDEPPGPPTPDVFDWDTDIWFTGDYWKFKGEIEPEVDDYDSWTATVSLARLGEDNSKTDPLSVASVDIDHPDVSHEVMDSDDGADGIVRCDDNHGRISFEGRSESIGTSDPFSGLVGKLRLKISGEVVESGGDE
jgi:hypothetical protein